MQQSNNGRMLGVARQPFCGKCCGEHTKQGNAKQKRAQRRADKQKLSAPPHRVRAQNTTSEGREEL